MADGTVTLDYRGVKVTVAEATAALLSSDYKPAEAPAAKAERKPRAKKPE